MLRRASARAPEASTWDVVPRRSKVYTNFGVPLVNRTSGLVRCSLGHTGQSLRTGFPGT